MTGRLDAYIYYTVPDKAFERAARWAAKNNSADVEFVEFIGVKTRQDFINAWHGIHDQAQSNGAKVEFVMTLTHASKGDGDLDGLEFASGPIGSGSSTLSRQDIINLPRLPWTDDGYMYLAACNSGNVGERGWDPAQAFFQSQGLWGVAGEKGYAYFSRKAAQYEESGPNDKELYLFAYNRMRNSPLGDGKRIKPTKYFRQSFDDTNRDEISANPHYLALRHPEDTEEESCQEVSQAAIATQSNLMLLSQKTPPAASERKANDDDATATIARAPGSNC